MLNPSHRAVISKLYCIHLSSLTNDVDFLKVAVNVEGIEDIQTVPDAILYVMLVKMTAKPEFFWFFKKKYFEYKKKIIFAFRMVQSS